MPGAGDKSPVTFSNKVTKTDDTAVGGAASFYLCRARPAVYNREEKYDFPATRKGMRRRHRC